MTIDYTLGVTIVCAILVVQNIVQMLWINRLINKLMSRSFYDYKLTTAMDATLKKDTLKKGSNVPEVVKDDNLDDLGVLEGF